MRYSSSRLPRRAAPAGAPPQAAAGRRAAGSAARPRTARAQGTVQRVDGLARASGAAVHDRAQIERLVVIRVRGEHGGQLARGSRKVAAVERDLGQRDARLGRARGGLQRRARAALRDRDIADDGGDGDRKSTRLNSSHLVISYAVFCLKKKKKTTTKNTA